MRARPEDLTWRNVGGQVVILDLRDSSYLRTNATGAVLWEVLQQDCTAQDLVSALVESFGIDKARAAADVMQFLEMMTANDLLADSR